MPLVLLFSDPVLLPQIMLNCHNRILTPLHALLYICGLTTLRRTQNAASIAQGRGKVLYMRFHPYACARVNSGRGCLLYITVSHYNPTSPAAATSGRQSPPPAAPGGGQRATHHRPEGRRGEESPGAACSPVPALYAALPNDSPNDSVKRESRQIDRIIHRMVQRTAPADANLQKS